MKQLFLNLIEFEIILLKFHTIIKMCVGVIMLYIKNIALEKADGTQTEHGRKRSAFVSRTILLLDVLHKKNVLILLKVTVKQLPL